VPSIGDPAKIVSGTTEITKSPDRLIIAEYVARFLRDAGIMRNGFSFQAGSGGIGLAFYIGLPPTLGATLFSLAISMLMGVASFKSKERADTIIGVMWAIGMALGIILIELTPGYGVDLMSYLFGSILSVPRLDIWCMCGLALFVIAMVVFFYREFIAMSYDEEFASVAGVPVRLLYFTLLGLISLSVVMIIRVVGLILVIALLTMPPYIAEKYTNSLGKMMIVASCLGVLFTLTGLWVSYRYNLTSGATIIMVGGVGFFLSLGVDDPDLRVPPGYLRQRNPQGAARGPGA
jgi:zinc transport system permease protein